jgi:hypothetical protein
MNLLYVIDFYGIYIYLIFANTDAEALRRPF